MPTAAEPTARPAAKHTARPAPSPRWTPDAVLSRALVTDDDAKEALSWWACLLVCAVSKRHPPLRAPTLQDSALAVAAAPAAMLLTPYQARQLGFRRDETQQAFSPGPLVNASATPFSQEYVYSLRLLASKSDRTFRKACRRAEAAMSVPVEMMVVATREPVWMVLVGVGEPEILQTLSFNVFRFNAGAAGAAGGVVHV